MMRASGSAGELRFGIEAMFVFEILTVGFYFQNLGDGREFWLFEGFERKGLNGRFCSWGFEREGCK